MGVVWRRVAPWHRVGGRGRRDTAVKTKISPAVHAALGWLGWAARGIRTVEMKKLHEQQLNNLMKRWMAGPVAADRVDFPARRGSAPRTVMRGLAGHLSHLTGIDTKAPRPA